MKRDIELHDYYYFDEFVAIFGLGVIKCLQENLMSIDEAEYWLFMPYNVDQLKAGKFSKDVRLGVDLGTELYACMDICSPEVVEKSIQDIYDLFANFIKKNVQEKHTNKYGRYMRGFHVKPRKRKKTKATKNKTNVPTVND